MGPRPTWHERYLDTVSKTVVHPIRAKWTGSVFPAQRRFSLTKMSRNDGWGHSIPSAAVVRETHIGGLSAADLRFAIIVSRFNDLVTKLLLEGTIEGATSSWSTRGKCRGHDLGLQVIWVPGSFELPVVAKSLAKSGKFDAVIAVGTVVSFSRVSASFSSIKLSGLDACMRS
eukprot:jgi/Botrbrau1/17702/Bobra.0166s0126.1